MGRKIERFLQFLKYKGISENRATTECGLSQGLLHQAKSGKSDLGAKSIEKILDKYQELSRVWLLTGEGEMFRDANIQTSFGDFSPNVSGNGKITQNIDNRQYYSDSPDVLRAQIDKLDLIITEKEERIKEKDAQIKEKDAQIKALLDILRK